MSLLQNRPEKLAKGLFFLLFPKLLQIYFIFSDNIHTCIRIICHRIPHIFVMDNRLKCHVKKPFEVISKSNIHIKYFLYFIIKITFMYLISYNSDIALKMWISKEFWFYIEIRSLGLVEVITNVQLWCHFPYLSFSNIYLAK